MPPVTRKTPRKPATGGAQVLHADMQKMQEELEQHSEILEEMNKHLKKMERSGRLTSLASWARVLLLYLPILLILLFTVFILPQKIKEYATPYTSLIGIGEASQEDETSKSTLDGYKEIAQDLSPKQLGDLKEVIDSIR